MAHSHTLSVPLSTPGCKLFTNAFTSSPTSMMFQYVSMILQCTGGGIIVPLLINSIPVPLGQDSYIIIISISFLLHYYFPILRDVAMQSSILYCGMIVMYEILRAYVVVKFINSAAATIPPSEFTIPVFGPIICGTIAGCGAAFIPFNKGLDAIKQSLIPPVISAGLGSVFYHAIVATTSTGKRTSPACCILYCVSHIDH
jgi:TRIC channel